MSCRRIVRAALACVAAAGFVGLWGPPLLRPAVAQQDRPGATTSESAGRSCRVLIRTPAPPRSPDGRPSRPNVGASIARALSQMGCAPGDALLVLGAGLNAAAVAADFCDFSRQMLVTEAERTAASPVVTLACIYAGGRREPRVGGQDT
jgi:hypothetical protein